MYADYNYSYVIRSDFNEVINSRIINQLKENLQNHKFFIHIVRYNITRDLLFIKKFVSQINELKLDATGLKSKDMEEIKCILSNSSIKVSFVALIIFLQIVSWCLTVKE